MAMNSLSLEDRPPLKSLKADEFALVTFINRTLRNVSVYWLDYSGERVRYAVLTPREEIAITTFVTHPWMFRDADTGDTLVTGDHEEVFFPMASDFESQTLLSICLPVYSLYNCCLQAVRKLKTDQEMANLEVPKEVRRDLLSKETVPYKVHLTF